MSNFLLIMTLLIRSVSGNSAATSIDNGKTGLTVSQFVSDKNEIVLISGGKNRGIVEGALFLSYRKAVDPSNSKPIDIQTGHLKALQVQDSVTIAKVLTSGTELSKAFFPKFTGVMAGDYVEEIKVAIERTQIVTPTAELVYHDLFEDPKASPETFELKESGKEKLTSAAKALAQVRLPLLLVEGHTDQTGQAEANQIESYQRALTVRQFLVNQLGFDPERVIAVGLGEAEPPTGEVVPGFRKTHRRITLKALAEEALR